MEPIVGALSDIGLVEVTGVAIAAGAGFGIYREAQKRMRPKPIFEIARHPQLRDDDWLQIVIRNRAEVSIEIESISCKGNGKLSQSPNAPLTDTIDIDAEIKPLGHTRTVGRLRATKQAPGDSLYLTILLNPAPRRLRFNWRWRDQAKRRSTTLRIPRM